MISGKQIDKENPLLLASSSPRRKAILNSLHIPYRTVVYNADEDFKLGKHPADIASEIAILKAESIKNDHKGSWILGADTIVVLDKKIFGKPGEPRECTDMLLALSGRYHQVITGFCLLDTQGKPAHAQAVKTEVKIKELTGSEIQGYIKTGEPYGKAGGYAIQGLGSFMVEEIKGSYTNVVGLPVYELICALLRCGALKEFP